MTDPQMTICHNDKLSKLSNLTNCHFGGGLFLVLVCSCWSVCSGGSSGTLVSKDISLE